MCGGEPCSARPAEYIWPGWEAAGSPPSIAMGRSPVLLTLALAVFMSLLAQSSGDEVKHKKIIIKVPSKVNHIHHHHVKKMHIWKHKPKPIHSVHIVEEDHFPLEHDWRNLKKHKQFSGWKDVKPVHEEWEDEEDEYEEEFHDDDKHKKSGSHYEPVVWKGGKGSRGIGGGKKWREPSAVSGRSREKTRSSYKGDRSKRQKSPGHYEDRWPEESRYNTRVKGKKPKKGSKGKSAYSRRPRPKPKPYRPIEKGYADYDDLDAPVWPERKEHISWHLRGDAGSLQEHMGVTEGPFIQQNEYTREHHGEIDLSKRPEIPVVPPPNLVTNSQPLPVEKTPNKKKENPKLSELQKPKVFNQVVTDGFHTHFDQGGGGFHTHFDQGGGVLAGYSSHVGHNAEGDSASFQTVTFGEKKKYRHH